jgi:hypothetical protein
MLDEFFRRVFDTLASSKEQNQTFLLDELARQAKLSIKLYTLLISVNAP